MTGPPTPPAEVYEAAARAADHWYDHEATNCEHLPEQPKPCGPCSSKGEVAAATAAVWPLAFAAGQTQAEHDLTAGTPAPPPPRNGTAKPPATTAMLAGCATVALTDDEGRSGSYWGVDLPGGESVRGIVRCRIEYEPEPPQIVVEVADEYVEVSVDMLDHWRGNDGLPPVTRKTIDGREVFSFGTVGEGLGVVSYEVVREPPDERDRITVFGDEKANLRVLLHATALLRRVS